MDRGRLASVGRRRPALGPLLYISCAQYFIVQVVVGEMWNPSYNWSRDPISDLGNTACGTFNAHRVCSPQHDLMNVSFVLLGASMLIGSLLNRHSNLAGRGSSVGFRCLEIAGGGVILVGLFPENTVSALHGLGAALAFVIGNIGIIVLGVSLRLRLALRVVSVCLGVIALTALVAYASSHYLGLGEGGIERVVAYPQTLWLLGVGTYMVRTLRRKQSRAD
jgi:hypothetical membrane protein